MPAVPADNVFKKFACDTGKHISKIFKIRKNAQLTPLCKRNNRENIISIG